MRDDDSSTFCFGSITVLAHNVFVARQVADQVRAIPASERPREGTVTVDGQQIRWWILSSPDQKNKMEASR